MKQEQPDRLWKALADPHRRQILDLLRERPRTTGELAAGLPFSRFAAMKHLGVLVAAGLVVVERRGRERLNLLNPLPLQEISRRWLRPYEAIQGEALLRLREHLERPQFTKPGLAKPGLAKGETMQAETTATAFAAEEVALEIEIAAPPERVWQAWTEEIAAWWPRDFYTGATPRAFVFEARLGGRLYEDWGDGQGLVWYTVTGLDAPKRIRLAGDLAPDFGGPARVLTSIVLEPTAGFELTGGGTRLRFSETVFGRLGARTASDLRDGWQFLIGGCLKPWVEEGKHPERPAGVG